MGLTPEYNWILLSLTVAALFAFINIIDKSFVHKLKFSPSLLTVLVGSAGIIPVIILCCFAEGLRSISWPIMFLTLLNGTLSVTFIFLYFHALKNAATDAMIATLQASTVFSILWGYFFFNERFDLLTYTGIFILLTSLVLLSINRNSDRGLNNKSLLLSICYTLAASFILSISMALHKYNTSYAEPLIIFFWCRIGCLVTIVLFLLMHKKLRSVTFRHVAHYKIKLFYFVIIEHLYFIAIILRITAISQGYLTFVATCVSVQPLFVTLFLFTRNVLIRYRYLAPSSCRIHTLTLYRTILVSIVVSGSIVVVLQTH